jgi:hypothetical protein
MVSWRQEYGIYASDYKHSCRLVCVKEILFVDNQPSTWQPHGNVVVSLYVA